MLSVSTSTSSFPLAIAWCGAGPPSAVDGSRCWKVQVYELHELQDSRAELIVLESSAFETLEHCRDTYQNLAPSVLLIVRPDELADVLGWLRNKDDVCVTSVPPSLVAHRIRRLADSRGKLIDSLTGVFARPHLISVLHQCSEDACSRRPVSLILADLDHFKAINDRHGHAAGDRVLEQCGAMLRSICGPGELAARCGGQEFAVLAREDADGAYQLAERIRRNQSTLVVPGIHLGLEGYLRIWLGGKQDYFEEGLRRIAAELS